MHVTLGLTLGSSCSPTNTTPSTTCSSTPAPTPTLSHSPLKAPKFVLASASRSRVSLFHCKICPTANSFPYAMKTFSAHLLGIRFGHVRLVSTNAQVHLSVDSCFLDFGLTLNQDTERYMGRSEVVGTLCRSLNLINRARSNEVVDIGQVCT